MNTTEADLLSSAIAFATAAHHGQYRKFTGDPYIVHPLRVMTAVQHLSLPVRIAAVLHDVVEDGTVHLIDIRPPFGWKVCALVDTLSRRRGETYAQFISRIIKAGPDAMAIKEADIRDNLVGLQDEGLRGRYSTALDRLTRP